MAKPVSILGNHLPLANAGLKLSKNIPIEKIEEHPKFKELFHIDHDLLERIKNDITKNKFDASQPVHIWETTDENGTQHKYLIDGYTRVEAARQAGLDVIPYFGHSFETFDEAHRYSLHLQVDRRNLSDADLMRNLRMLMGAEYVKEHDGDKAALLAEETGLGRTTVIKALSVERNATDEQKERIESGDATINQIYSENHPKRNTIKSCDDKEVSSTNEINPNDNIETKEDNKEYLNNNKDSDNTATAKDKSFTTSDKPRKAKRDDNDSNRSEALNDSYGTPAGLPSFNHSDGIERPDIKPWEGCEADYKTQETSEKEDIINKREFDKAFADGFEKGLIFALSEVSRGRTAQDVWNDERISDLSSSVIAQFKLPPDAEDIVASFEK